MSERLGAPVVLGGALCAACGMCCNGGLYGTVGLRAEEVGAASRLGLALLERATGPAFHQPCTAHRDGACAIYDERPKTCADYACTLLKAYRKGEIDLTRAVRRVKEAAALAASIRGRLPVEGAHERPLWDAIRAFSELAAPTDDAARHREHEALRADVATLLVLCHRSFDPRVGPFDESGR